MTLARDGAGGLLRARGEGRSVSGAAKRRFALAHLCLFLFRAAPARRTGGDGTAIDLGRLAAQAAGHHRIPGRVHEEERCPVQCLPNTVIHRPGPRNGILEM